MMQVIVPLKREYDVFCVVEDSCSAQSVCDSSTAWKKDSEHSQAHKQAHKQTTTEILEPTTPSPGLSIE